jgi:non-heme chloroperoxidase
MIIDSNRSVKTFVLQKQQDMKRIKAKDEISLFYKDMGTGKPVVFVHGWCINCDSWEYIMDSITESGYRCIAYDQRGCGRSDQSWTGYDYKSLAADLDVLLNTLALNEVTLVGHSLGGGVIAQYLADYGEERIKSAVIISTTIPGMMKNDDNPEGLDIALYEMAVEFMKKDRASYTYGLAENFFNLKESNVSKEMVDWSLAITMQASSRAAVEMLNTALNSSQVEELKKINTPFLILHGDKDVNCPIPLTADKTQKLLKNSQLKIYKDQPHGMYISEPQMISADILEFIAD